MSRDYSNSSIYVIRNHVNDMVYVGSTTQCLAKRWWEHKSGWKHGYKVSVYAAFTELGFDKFYIELFEEINCENNAQLTRREGEVIRSFGDKAYNKVIAGRTYAEWQADNKEKVEGYKNKEKADAYQVAHRAENKEEINEAQRKYYSEHKEKADAYQVRYRAKNKDKVHAAQVAYYTQNKERIAAYQAAYRARKKMTQNLKVI